MYLCNLLIIYLSISISIIIYLIYLSSLSSTYLSSITHLSNIYVSIHISIYYHLFKFPRQATYS